MRAENAALKQIVAQLEAALGIEPSALTQGGAQPLVAEPGDGGGALPAEAPSVSGAGEMGSGGEQGPGAEELGGGAPGLGPEHVVGSDAAGYDDAEAGLRQRRRPSDEQHGGAV